MLSRSAALALASLLVAAAPAASEFPVPEVLLWEGASGASHSRSAVPPAATAPVPLLGLGTAPLARLVWLDPSGIAQGAEAITRLEVVELLRGMGISASWRHGDPHELSRQGELRVIFLNRPGTSENGMSVLGATPPGFDEEPHVWVHVPSVSEVVGIERLRAGTTLDPHSAHRLGIGLARVVAHEVVHALVPTLPHGKGLMSARLDRRTLTASTIAVDSEVGLAVRAALQGARPRTPAAGAMLAAESTREEPE